MSDAVAILGSGMHPWGRWGRQVIEYAKVAARVAIADAGITPDDVGFLVAAGTVRCGYPGYVAASTLSRALGLRDVEAVTTYAACASGAQALAVARDRILAGGCDVALVVGADVATPLQAQGCGEGAVARELPSRAWLGLRAARRVHERGTTAQDLHAVRIKNSAHGTHNENARFRTALSASAIESSPVVASPLRLLHLSTFSDGAAAIVMASEEYARKVQGLRVRVRAISLSILGDEGIEMPFLSGRSTRVGSPSGRAANVARTLRQSGIAPGELSAVELYDTSSVSELDWYEHIGLCGSSGAEALLRSGATSLGGGIPVNASGGLTSFGEAVSAQAIAQICELTWQLQGRCGRRQIPGARTGLAVCDGMYGHVASTILST